MSSPYLNNTLSAVIVDDELHGRENLKKILETYFTEVEVLGLADSVIDAKNMVKKHTPDVVFLDINMPVLDGFDFLDEFDNRRFMIVFVSAYSEYGINAVKAGAADYILKPVNIKELKQTIKKLILLKNNSLKEKFFSEDKIVIPASQGFSVLPFTDIIYIKAEGSYSRIFLKNGKSEMISRTLKDFENVLPGDEFFRTHKSYLVNLKYVKEYKNADGGVIFMSEGSRIEISRRKTPEFVNRVKLMLHAI